MTIYFTIIHSPTKFYEALDTTGLTLKGADHLYVPLNQCQPASFTKYLHAEKKQTFSIASDTGHSQMEVPSAGLVDSQYQ